MEYWWNGCVWVQKPWEEICKASSKSWSRGCSLHPLALSQVCWPQNGLWMPSVSWLHLLSCLALFKTVPHQSVNAYAASKLKNQEQFLYQFLQRHGCDLWFHFRCSPVIVFDTRGKTLEHGSTWTTTWTMSTMSKAWNWLIMEWERQATAAWFAALAKQTQTQWQSHQVFLSLCCHISIAIFIAKVYTKLKTY